MMHILVRPFMIFLLIVLNACQTTQPIGPQLLRDDGGTFNKHNHLSSGRINEIRRSFIGRRFVIKEDWYQFLRIDSDPHGGFGDPVSETNYSENIIRKKATHRLVAPAGTAARIKGYESSRTG
jgi:hypothetical protein